MAVISSENKTCASDSLLELYRSPGYRFTTSMNCLVPIVSLILSIRAIRKLCSQSIIQYSPRILLIATVLFAMCHQIAYFSFKVDVLYQMYFKLNDSCNLQHTSYDCRFITIGTTTGNCGMTLIHLGMTLDRLFALMVPEKHLEMKSVPGILITLVVFIISFLMWFVITVNDPLTGWVNHCGFYPTYSVQNFNMLLRVTLYLTIFNFLLDILVLWWSIRREIRWRDTYNMISRFQTRVALRCTQAMFLISVCQFISSVLYSGLTWLLMVLGREMSSAAYSLSLSIIYVNMHPSNDSFFSFIGHPIRMSRVATPHLPRAQLYKRTAYKRNIVTAEATAESERAYGENEIGVEIGNNTVQIKKRIIHLNHQIIDSQ